MPRGAAAATPAALLLFVHGGYWQELSAADSLFAAAACIERGIAFAALDYTLAPAASLPAIVAECRSALAWLCTHAPRLGIDATRVVVAGSSAGAHLSAMMALPAAPAGAGVSIAPRAAVLVSGIYWLEPLRGTSIDAALALDAGSARQASPSLLPLSGFPPTVLCWGEIETAAFKAQSRAFAALLREAGTPCDLFEVPGRNHFDVILDLADDTTALGQRTLGALR
jgi:arylformamidase